MADNDGVSQDSVQEEGFRFQFEDVGRFTILAHTNNVAEDVVEGLRQFLIKKGFVERASGWVVQNRHEMTARVQLLNSDDWPIYIAEFVEAKGSFRLYQVKKLVPDPEHCFENGSGPHEFHFTSARDGVVCTLCAMPKPEPTEAEEVA